MSSCFCIGPQNGQPICPCHMRRVEVRNGRYVEVIDHGPVVDQAKERQRDHELREWVKNTTWYPL
jgi:hypothetical protein